MAYYDGPLLLWLPVPGRRVLAIALLEEPELERPWPFLLAELSESTAQAMLGNRITVRRAVLDALNYQLLPDYGADILAYQPLQREEVSPEWLPGDVTLDMPVDIPGA